VPVTSNKQSPAANTTNATPRTSRKTRRNHNNAANTKTRQSLGNRSQHTITPVVPSRPSTKKNSHRRSSQILVKLSNACQSHQNDCHPPSNQRDHNNNDNATGTKAVNNERANRIGAVEAEIPATCQSALSKLESLLPKLQREIPPKQAIGGGLSEISNEEYAAILGDVLLLCDFYSSILSGYHCPYMPQLFHWGKHVSSSEFWENIFLLLSVRCS
jgi:hypothetical protein